MTNTQIQTPTTPLFHFLVRVDREMDVLDDDSVAYERIYHTTAETAEQATIKVAKHLLNVFDFDHFPDYFFAHLELADDYDGDNLPDVISPEEAEVYKLLDKYVKDHGSLPFSNDNIVYDENTENTAYMYIPTQVSESTYLETKNTVPYIEL